MISRIHQKLGTAGFIISIVALVAALGGGAYAANSALSGKQKKEVEKIAKKYAGKPGAAGATGPAGPAGASGKNGTDGSNGAPGVGTEGKQGIQGEEGTEGAEGSPWTAGGTLPKGATETGTWAVSASPELADSNGDVRVPISFPIPLSHELEFAKGKVHIVTAFGEGVCEGTAYEPSAPEGELCIYEAEEHGVTLFETENLERFPNAAQVSGTVLVFNNIQAHGWATGGWAVTGN